MSEWITHRRPTADDAIAYCYEGLVWAYTKSGPRLYAWDQVDNEPWQPIDVPEPYVKPKRFEVRDAYVGGGFVVINAEKFSTAIPVPTREAAERILAIYEEVVPHE